MNCMIHDAYGNMAARFVDYDSFAFKRVIIGFNMQI